MANKSVAPIPVRDREPSIFSQSPRGDLDPGRGLSALVLAGVHETDHALHGLAVKTHPDYFPVDINKASKLQLLRVPGLGDITVSRILEYRKNSQIRRITDFARPTKLITKAAEYLAF